MISPELTQKINKVLDNRPLMIVIMLSAAAGIIATLAGGFVLTYRAITFLSNQF